jgi:hypothetical protein
VSDRAHIVSLVLVALFLVGCWAAWHEGMIAGSWSYWCDGGNR